MNAIIKIKYVHFKIKIKKNKKSTVILEIEILYQLLPSRFGELDIAEVSLLGIYTYPH